MKVSILRIMFWPLHWVKGRGSHTRHHHNHRKSTRATKNHHNILFLSNQKPPQITNEISQQPKTTTNEISQQPKITNQTNPSHPLLQPRSARLHLQTVGIGTARLGQRGGVRASRRGRRGQRLSFVAWPAGWLQI